MSPIRLPGGLACWAIAHIAIFWLWQLASAYAWALGSDAAYWFMQISLLLRACGLWVALLLSSAPKAATPLLALMVQLVLFGTLLTFIRSVVPVVGKQCVSTFRNMRVQLT